MRVTNYASDKLGSYKLCKGQTILVTNYANDPSNIVLSVTHVMLVDKYRVEHF